MSYAIVIAGLCWLAGCVYLYRGWCARKPDVYVHGNSATLPSVTDIHTVNVYGTGCHLGGRPIARPNSMTAMGLGGLSENTTEPTPPATIGPPDV